MKREWKGSFTIEAAVIVPIIFMLFSTILTMLFYYHDKNVMAALTHETLVMGCNKEEITEEEVEGYLRQRIQNKMLLFGTVHPEAKFQRERLTISCSARKNRMSINIKQSMKKTNPEQYIWKLRRMNLMKKE